VPPANLVWLGVAGFAIGLRARLGRVMLAIGVAGLFIAAMPVTGALLFVALERSLPVLPPAVAPPRAIVILTGDEGHGDGLLPGAPSPGPLSLERLRAAAVLYRRAPLPVLISGGSLHPGEEPLASVLARSLKEDFHIQVALLETGSHDTWQSAALTAATLRTAGIDSVYLVTHGWHMRRALIAFRHFGIPATAAPVRIDGMPRFSLDDFLPAVRGWVASYDALHEWIGCAYYALR
jgi:uncharacterized SAM-binding protein YcdF (DUF218 family)